MEEEYVDPHAAPDPTDPQEAEGPKNDEVPLDGEEEEEEDK